MIRAKHRPAISSRGIFLLKEMDKFVFIGEVVRGTLEVISRDLLERYNRWIQENRPRLDQLPDFHINYTAAFLSYSLLAMYTVKLSQDPKNKEYLKEFNDHLQTCISAIRFFSTQFDTKEDIKPGQISSYKEVLERLEILAQEVGGKRVYSRGGEEVEIVTIGGYDFDRESRYHSQYGIPAGGSHQLWMDKLRAKYEIVGGLKTGGGHDDDLILREFFKDILPAGISETAEQILQMTSAEQAKFWGKLSGIDKSLIAQAKAAVPLLGAFAKYANADEPKVEDVSSLLDAMDTIVKQLRRKDEAELREELLSIPGKDFAASVDSECAAVKERGNVLLSRHRCIRNIEDGIKRIREELSQLGSDVKTAQIDTSCDVCEALDAIMRSNEETAQIIQSDEKRYVALSNLLRNIMREIAALLSPMNKATCIRNVRLIVRAITRAQMAEHPCAKDLEAMFGVQLWDPTQKKLIPENLDELISKIL